MRWLWSGRRHERRTADSSTLVVREAVPRHWPAAPPNSRRHFRCDGRALLAGQCPRPADDREALEIQAQFEVRTFRTTEQVSFVAPGTNTSMWVRFAPGDPTKSTFLHPRYEERLITVDAFGEYDNLAIHALSPVDLAVSRLARFSELDQLEIRGLLRAGLFSAAELDRIATETLNVYLSRTSDIAANLRAALQLGPRDFGE